MRAEDTIFFPVVAATDGWLQRLLVWTPGQADLIKTVALILMVADHISLIFWPDHDVLRLPGRGAFPLFGLVWAMNLARHECIRQSSLNRLWVWAVVAQGGWILAGMRPYQGNILFAFAVSGQALALVQRYGSRGWPPSLGLILAWLPFSGSSYGPAGIMMLLLACGACMAGRPGTRVGLAACLVPVMLALNAGAGAAMMAAGLVIPLVTLAALTRSGKPPARFWPRDFFPLFYVVHLAVLGLIAM